MSRRLTALTAATMLVAGSLAISVGQSTAQPRAATYPSTSGVLLALKGGNLFRVKADGTGWTKLTTGGGYSGAQWSPDGTKIAYARNGDIFVMSATGSNVAQVTTHAADEMSPTWSPDGQRLAFTSNRRNGLLDIFTLRSTKPFGTSTRLTSSSTDSQTGDQTQYESPRWSPVENTIAFVERTRYSGWPSDTVIGYVDGTTGAPVHLHHAYGNAVEWAPKGSKIVYQNAGNSDIGLPTWITRVDTSGTNRVDVTPQNDCSEGCWGDAANPVWSADGSTIAYSDYDDAGQIGIWLAKPDGSTRQLFRLGAVPLDWKA